MTAPSSPTNHDNQPNALLGVVRILVIVPGLIVARFTSDVVPFVPGWGEYILFAGGSFVLGNAVISALAALDKRASSVAANSRAGLQRDEAISMWRAIPVVLGISAAGLLIALTFIVGPFILLTR